MGILDKIFGTPKEEEIAEESEKTKKKREVGDVNEEGKVWTEYQPGKFGWRKPKDEDSDPSGYVYIVSNVGSFGPDVFKIGATKCKDPQKRVNELSDASVPFSFAVHTLIYSDNVYELEAQIRRFLRDKEINKINHRKEFFRVSLDEIKEIIRKLGYKPKWDDQAIDVNYLKSKA